MAPATDVDSGEAKAAVAPGSPGIRVLLVEDNSGDVDLVRTSLRDATAAFVVSSAETLRQAIDQVHHEPFDVILLDLRLPDSKGLDTLRTMLSVAGQIPVIVFTVTEDDKIGVQAVRLGAQDYLVKGEATRWMIHRVIEHAIERRRAQDAVQESEKMLNTLADNAACVIGIIQGTKFVFVNRYMEKLSGYTMEELLSVDFEQMVHPEFRQLMADRARRRQQGKPVPNRYEFKMLTKSGQTRWMDFSAGMIEYGGRPAIIGTGFDITDRKQAEADLLDANRRLSLLIQTANLAMAAETPEEIAHGLFDKIREHLQADMLISYVLDTPTGRLRLDTAEGVDPTVLPMLEWADTHRAVCGRVIAEKTQVIGCDLQHCPDLDVGILRRLGIQTFVCTPLVVHDSVIATLWLGRRGNVSFSPQDRELVQSVCQQASLAMNAARLRAQEKEHHLRIEDFSSRLQRSNQDLEHFAYMASHDLQEPLRVISGFADLLRQKLETSADKQTMEYLGLMTDGTERMQRMIRDLLAYSRVSTRNENFRPVAIQRSYDIAVANLAGKIAQTHTTLSHDPLPEVTGDESLLALVFQNLISNAIKFRQAEAQPVIHVGSRREDRAWVISVRDNGIGIEPRHFERVFLLFQRLHTPEQYEGTGLGLALVKRIIEGHGGRIWVESSPGQGSTFSFTLPAELPAPY